jgi:hypothetical protein
MICLTFKIVDAYGIEKMITCNIKDLPYLNIIKIPNIKELRYREMGLKS